MFSYSYVSFFFRVYSLTRRLKYTNEACLSVSWFTGFSALFLVSLSVRSFPSILI
jgi:hypothetical protein